ncbi:MAG TPA: transposase [Clostridiaceae bacterium]|jgi:transposase|nr:transposase [Clostridiaceae bacterium]
MPKSKRRTYTKEFKLDVVSKKLNNIYKTKEICEKYDIDRQTLCRWVNEYKKGGEAAFESKAVLAGDEVRKLKERLKQVEMENEILKKAEAYFARHKQTK